MYSSKVTQSNLLKAEAIIRSKHSLSTRWYLKPSTNGEREDMKAHLNTLLDSKGYLIRDLTNEERLWVLIESTFCKLDFHYFSSNYAKIENWQARIALFTPNIAQKIVLSLMSDFEDNSYALMFMFLKARQLGVTTLFQIVLAHRVFFYRNVGAYTGSAEESKSREMIGKLEFIWKHLPWWLRPRETANRAGELIEYSDLNSSINVQWGNQKGGIARGATPTIAHLSELSTFLKPEELVDAALARAMHENPFSLLALESTANVLGDWWHRTWEFNISMDSKGLAKYKPVFLPWYVGSDLYPTESAYKRRPSPDDWKVPSYVESHALAAEKYVESNKILSTALGKNWKMTQRQKWWYYLEYEEAKRKNQLHILLRELPASSDEAFQNANPSVFSLETLIEVRTQTTSSKPEGIFQISGVSIPSIYSDSKITGESTIAKCYSSDNDLLDTFNLDSIDIDSWPDNSPDLKLYIWEWPKAGETYGIYCDPSEGVGQDNSVVGVIKKSTPFHPDEQVAEWSSNKVAPHDLWAYIYCLAHLYTVRHNVTKDWNEPLVVIETNIAAGDAAQTEMLKRGYSNFYRQSDLTMIGDTGNAYNSKPRSLKDRIGWRTDRSNRPRLLSLFRKLVRDGNFKIKSPYLAREMSTLEYNLDKQRIEASIGEHDDRVMGSAMLLCSWYDPEIYGTAPTNFIEERQLDSLIDNNPSYSGDTLIGRSSKYVVKYKDLSDSRSILYG